uniref:DUF6273 domain-containing protein n=1 Tax=uncultured bacterium Contigcl_24 TaxID=1393668 RepID=W0FQ58_9BACT|nr:hypothetical protein [uncultured bacterium Contigcl_24]
MKRTVLALLMISILLFVSFGTGESFENLVVPVSMGEFLGRYPDEEIVNEDGSVTEVYSGITQELLDGFTDFVRDKTARLLKDQKEAASEEEAFVLTGTIKADRLGVALPFEYHYDSGEMKITYPAGTVDERTNTAREQFEKMKSMADAGLYDDAARAYLMIPDSGCYKPAAELAAASEGVQHAIRRSNLKIAGSHVFFGSYEQDNDPDNGPEPIEWIVLDTQEGKSLLISRYALDAGAYHTEYTPVTWETCALRAWLNNDFLNTAFAGEEQQAILKAAVENSPGQGYDEYETDGGNSTQDSVFLLSYEEAWRLFPTDEARRCIPTAYAAGRGVWLSTGNLADGETACAWWLRSPGGLQGCAIRVRGDGCLGSSFADDRDPGVRPVIWVSLSSDVF